MGQEWCGKWMPRKKTTCARTPGHGGPCKTAETMVRNKLYNRDHPHRESPESRKKSNRKYRISSYGLTQELFDLLLEAQQTPVACATSRLARGSSSTWTMITRAAGGRTDRAESAYGDSCAIRAISRWATSNADTRWLALTWTALPSGSSPPPSLQTGKAAAARLPQPASVRAAGWGPRSGSKHPAGPKHPGRRVSDQRSVTRFGLTLERSLPSFVSIHAASDIRSNYGELDPRTRVSHKLMTPPQQTVGETNRSRSVTYSATGKARPGRPSQAVAWCLSMNPVSLRWLFAPSWRM